MNKPWLFKVNKFTACVVGAPNENAAKKHIEVLYPRATIVRMGEENRSLQQQWESGTVGIMFPKKAQQ